VYLAVTVDTEEDQWGDYTRATYTVENLARVPRLQSIFEKHGVLPTYLVSYPVATSGLGIEILGRYAAEGRCEIGTHPHPWNTPPSEEDRVPANSFIHRLPLDLQFRKIKTLHDAIARNVGTPPRSYRSGRWGFSEAIARHLVRLGYRVDTSISAATDWSEYGGPDYSLHDVTPFVFEARREDGTIEGSLLEVPATAAFVQPQAAAASVYWSLRRRAAGRLVLAALGKVRAINHVSLSPELHDAAEMIRLVDALRARGTRVLNMFFHSPSLLEGCGPFVRTAGEAEEFLDRIDRVLGFARSVGCRPARMSELSSAALAASSVRTLAAEPAVA
jgi:hypothetical protein